MTPPGDDRLQATLIGDLGFFRRLLGRAGEQGDDALHEAWLRLQSAAPREEIRQPRAYLARMLRNSVIDKVRQRHRRDAVDREVADILSGADTPSPERHLAGRQALALVATTLDELHPRCREVFLLSRVEGQSHRAIAQRLGISEKTVQYHIRRAIDHLAPLRSQIYGDDSQP